VAVSGGLPGGDDPGGVGGTVGGAPEDGGGARVAFRSELDQLRLQVELMGVRVDENLERMRAVLATGDVSVAALAIATDDDIDAMNVSLTERCYAILTLEAPVASDLRLVVSVLRVIGEFERIGDLALRVVKLAPRHRLLTADAAAHDILVVMADAAVERFRMAVRAWVTLDADLAVDLTGAPAELELAMEHLTRRVHALVGPDAAEQAVAITSAARAVDRIADHTVVLGARVRYLVTGDPAHLAVEVR